MNRPTAEQAGLIHAAKSYMDAYLSIDMAIGQLPGDYYAETVPEVFGGIVAGLLDHCQRAIVEADTGVEATISDRDLGEQLVEAGVLGADVVEQYPDVVRAFGLMMLLSGVLGQEPGELFNLAEAPEPA